MQQNLPENYRDTLNSIDYWIYSPKSRILLMRMEGQHVQFDNDDAAFLARALAKDLPEKRRPTQP